MNRLLMRLKDCNDCGVKPGQPHQIGCDVERCSVCGHQRLSCGCSGHDKLFARWTGLWPGHAESKLFGIDLNEFYTMGYYKTFFVKPFRGEENAVDSPSPREKALLEALELMQILKEGISSANEELRKENRELKEIADQRSNDNFYLNRIIERLQGEPTVNMWEGQKKK